MIFRRWKEWLLRREVNTQWRCGYADGVQGLDIPATRIVPRTANNLAYLKGHHAGCAYRRAVVENGAPVDVTVVVPDIPEGDWTPILADWHEHFA